MNKQQELLLLEELAEKLGERSYAGAWMREQLPAIKDAMDSDLQAGCYAISFAEVRSIRAQAQQKVDAMIDRARDAAKAIKEGIRAEIKREVAEAAYAVTKIAQDASAAQQDAADAQYSALQRIRAQAENIKELWR